MPAKKTTPVETVDHTNDAHLKAVFLPGPEATVTEVHDHEVHLKELQLQLKNLKNKIDHHKRITKKDTDFISHLGWLAALSISVASVAAGM